MVVFCHEAINGPQNVSAEHCTSITLQFHHCIGMLKVLGGFDVRSLSEQHDTLHRPNGEFFWKFPLYICNFLWI